MTRNAGGGGNLAFSPGSTSAAQIVDMTALFFWEHAGKGLVWVDAITTAVYTILPLYIVAILIARLAATQAA